MYPSQSAMSHLHSLAQSMYIATFLPKHVIPTCFADYVTSTSGAIRLAFDLSPWPQVKTLDFVHQGPFLSLGLRWSKEILQFTMFGGVYESCPCSHSVQRRGTSPSGRAWPGNRRQPTPSKPNHSTSSTNNSVYPAKHLSYNACNICRCPLTYRCALTASPTASSPRLFLLRRLSPPRRLL